VRYTIKHTFNTDVDTFWTKVFFDLEYNKALFEDHLGFKGYNVLQMERDPDGSVHRRVECAPAIELPAVARKAIGNSTSYVEDGRFDAKSKRFTVEVTPKLGAEKIKTRLTLWAEARGDKRIERIVEVDNSVNLFGVGKILEVFIEKQMRATYDEAASFTNRWIAEKGL
jgi:uncharacterized protein DUF2505